MNIYQIKKDKKEKGDIRVAIVAGVHGNELGTMALAYNLLKHYNGFIEEKDIISKGEEQLERDDSHTITITIKHDHNIFHWIDPYRAPLEGICSMTIIPVVNEIGLRDSTREQNQCTADLNRGYENIYTDNVRNIINLIVKNSDVVIDLHCSSNLAKCFILDMDMSKLSLLIDNMSTFSKQSDTIFPYIIKGATPGTLKHYTNSFPNKLGFTWEQSGMNEILPDVNRESFCTLIPFIQYISELYHKTIEIESPNIMETPVKHYIAPVSGIVSTPIKDDFKTKYVKVYKGDILFIINDFEGNALFIQRAEEDVHVILLNTNRWVNFENLVAMVQPI